MQHRDAGAKGKNLFTDDSREFRELVARNKAHGILGPGCKVQYTTEAGRIVMPSVSSTITDEE